MEVKTLATGATGGELAAMVVAWRPDGEACFHDICWKALVDSAKLDNPFTLSRREKLMVTEARRTAEWVDSEERLHAEATRFAHTLSTAQYAIAFTGTEVHGHRKVSNNRQRASGLQRQPIGSDSDRQLTYITSPVGRLFVSAGDLYECSTRQCRLATQYTDHQRRLYATQYTDHQRRLAIVATHYGPSARPVTCKLRASIQSTML